MTLRWKPISLLLVFAMALAPTAYTTLFTIDASHVHAADAALVETGVATPARSHVTPVRVAYTVHADAVAPSPRPLSPQLAQRARRGTSSNPAWSHRGAPSRPRSPPRA